MTRTVSARISNSVHEELRNQCNKAGCTISEYMAASLELAMTGHSEFDFGDEEENENDEGPQESCEAQDIPKVHVKIP